MGWINRQRLLSGDSRACKDGKAQGESDGVCGCQGQSATVGGGEIGAAGWKSRNSRAAEMMESLAVRQRLSQENCGSGAEQHTPQRHSSCGGVALSKPRRSLEQSCLRWRYKIELCY